jgi:pyruvate formate-lyase/glycerol dehydratase family glycyl radical enzyme
MTDRVEKLKQHFMQSKPCLSADRLTLVTEAYQKFAGEAVPIFRAKVLYHILDHLPIYVGEDEMIVGTQNGTYRAVSIYPEYISAQWLKDDIDNLPLRTTDPIQVSPEVREQVMASIDYWIGKSTEDFFDTPGVLQDDVMAARRAGLITIGSRTMPSSHTMPNHQKLLSMGLNGYIARCRALIEQADGGSLEAQEKIDFWNACIIACKAVIRYAERHAEKAEALAAKETDPARKETYLTVAKNCRNVPANPPRTFHEAVQFVWFMQLMPHVETNSAGNGLGRYDQYMIPFYERDVDAGVLTADEALEMVECFYIKAAELLPLHNADDAKKFAGYPMWQILMVGGVDKDGNDATNALSYICLDAQHELKLSQPAVALRIHEGTPETLWKKGVQMIQEGLANPAFFNDKCAIPTVMAKGGTLEEARNWAIVGCIEPHPGGGNSDASPTGGYVNGLKCVELALHNGVDQETGEQVGPQTGDPRAFTCTQDVIDAVEEQLRNAWRLIVKGYNRVVPHHMLRLPVIFSSLIVDDCVEKGMSIQWGGAKHSYVGTFFCGPASVADCITAIDYAVFDKKLISMDSLITMLEENFEGNERFRQLLLNMPPKFGNNDPETDRICRNLLVHASEFVQQFQDARGGRYCLSNLSQTLNLVFGEHVGATPDGRKAGEPLSDNASPVQGKDLHGPTATVNSVAALDQATAWDGTLFNLRFDPRGVAGEKGLDVIEGVIKTYFEHNGLHIQINVVDTETLRKAQADPDSYRGLVVRVAGYLAYFTELDKNVQEDIIQRTAHLA